MAIHISNLEFCAWFFYFKNINADLVILWPAKDIHTADANHGCNLSLHGEVQWLFTKTPQWSMYQTFKFTQPAGRQL